MSLTLEQRAAIADTLAKRKADVFNSKFALGDPVLYLPGVGQAPQWDRVYGRAYVKDGSARVYLAGRELPVDTDQCSSPPIEASHVRAPAAGPARVWQIGVAFVLGGVVAVAGALLAPPATAVPAARIVIDCAAPAEVSGSAADAGRAQA